MATLCLATIHLSAQEPESSEARLRALGTVEVPGTVPVFYVPAAKERALRLQRSLQTAHAWYEKQFNIKVPILLAVLDQETKKKVENLRAWMYFPPRLGPRLIVMDSEASGEPAAGADRDHANGGILQGEQILFHDDGHILADALKVHTRNKSMQELVAAIFDVAYVGTQRPDMTFRLNFLRSLPASSPQYSSMADFDYLDNTDGLSLDNHVWYLRNLSRLADSMMRGRKLTDVVEKLQQAFPENVKLIPSEVQSRLERIWPGFSKIAGPLAGPALIERATLQPCHEVVRDSEQDFSFVIVQNSTQEWITVGLPSARTDTLRGQSWYVYRLARGQALEFSDGRCLAGRKQPSLAIVQPK